MAYIPEGYTIDPKVTEEVGKAVGGAASGAHSGGNRIFAGISASLTRNYIIKPFVTFFSVIFMWAFNALVKASPGRAMWIAEKVSDNFFKVDDFWSDWVASYMATMMPGGLSASQLKGKSLKGMSDTVSGAFVKNIMNEMLGMVLPTKEQIEQDPLKGAEKYLGVNMQFQMDSWLLHMLGDMQSFGIFKSLKDLPNAISWSFGLGWLSWLVMGTPFRIAINTPMERYFNSFYTQERLTPAQLCKARRAGMISGQEFFDQMSDYGYSGDVQDLIMKLNGDSLSESKMKELYFLGLIDEEYIKEQFLRKGQSDQEAELHKELIVNERVFKLRDKVINEAVDLFEVGELSERDLVSYLEVAGWTQNEINLQVTASLLALDAKGKLSNTDIANAVEKGFMAWAEGRTKLINRGYSTSDADMYLKLRIPESKWRS